MSSNSTATVLTEPRLRKCIDCGEAKELSAYLPSREACIDGYTARCRICIWSLASRERAARELSPLRRALTHHHHNTTIDFVAGIYR